LQPAIVGIGLGGSGIIPVLGKQASCLRTIGSRNPDPKVAALEEFRTLGNSIMAPWVMGCPWWSITTSRSAVPHRRDADVGAHVLPVLAACDGARASRRPRRIPHRSEWLPTMRRSTVEGTALAEAAEGIMAAPGLEVCI
jgi:L(+)-tartrate dehydratase alpha subunit